MSLLDSDKFLTEEDLMKIKDIIERLKKEDDLEMVFHQPVDIEGLGLEDYARIISKPMDLNTVLRNLDSGQYIKVSHALDDIQLIWDNCKKYNQEGSVNIFNKNFSLFTVLLKKWKIILKNSQKFFTIEHKNCNFICFEFI